jgi:hypothetical protein
MWAVIVALIVLGLLAPRPLELHEALHHPTA